MILFEGRILTYIWGLDEQTSKRGRLDPLMLTMEEVTGNSFQST